MTAELYSVPDDAPPDRVDVWLAQATGRSRSRIQSLIDSGYVARDGYPLLSASPRVRPGMVFSIDEPPPELALLVPQDIRERKGSFFTPQIWVEKSQQ